MPLPKPKSNEKKDEFVARFMEDKKMIAEFPDNDQRLAIAISQWATFGELKKDVSIFELNQQIVESNGELVNPQWILVFPVGSHYIEKYDRYIDIDADFFERVAEAFESPTLSKPFVDKDHEFGESYGDIVDYRWNSGVGMEFKIQFNKRGIEAIKEHEYSYISPAWGVVTNTSGESFTKLMAISLVNFPAFEGVLPTLQSQMAASKFGSVEEVNVLKKSQPKKEKIMDTMILAKEFNLAPEASVDAIAEEIKKLKKYNEDMVVLTKELEAEVKSANENEELALSKAQELGEKLAQIEKAELSKEAETFVEEAIKVGKLHPTQKELMLDKYVSDKDFVIALLSSVPEVDDSPKSVQKTETPKIELSKEDQDAMIRGGMDISDPEEVSAFLAAKRK